MPAKQTAAPQYQQTSFDLFEQVQGVIRTSVEEAGPQYHTGKLAEEVLDKLREEDPETLTSWLDVIAIDAIKTSIGHFRSAARRRESIFRSSAFDISEEVDGSHTLRRIGDMNKSDLDFVSRNYLKKAKTMTARGRKFAALAARLPDSRTTVRNSMISEEEVAEIFIGE